MKENMTGYPSIDKPWLKYYEGLRKFSIPEGNLYENLCRNISDCGDSIALRYNGLKITYKRLINNIDGVAEQLRKIGVQKGEIVSVCLPNIPEVVYLIFAINKIGAVGNMLDPRSGEEVLAEQLVESKSRILFSIDLAIDKFSRILWKTDVETAVAISAVDSLPFMIRQAVRIKDKSLRVKVNEDWLTWAVFLKRNKSLTGMASVITLDDDAFIAYTGGTTGVPKGVISTNRNLCAIAEAELIMGFDQEESDSVLDIAPPWTYYGLLNSLYAPLCMQLTVILVPKLAPDGLGKLILKEKPNHVITVPSALMTMMSDVCMEREDLSYLHSVIVGADKLDESIERTFNEFLHSHNANICVHKGYGMTEAMAATCITPKNSESIGSVGIPYICNIVTAFSMDAEAYEEMMTGETGEIAICGPSVMRGYFGNKSKETSKMLKIHQDGRTWLHTGDIGYVEEDGRVHIIGRIKRMFTRNGYKVFPATIEKCIMSVEQVKLAAVVAVSDNERGNIIKAYVVADCENQAIVDEIKRTVETNLYDYECPDIYEFLDRMPLTGMGKIDFKALEKRD